MQIVRQAFFNLRLIYALCQAHVENTRGWYTWFITPEHVSPTKQPQPPKKTTEKNNLAHVFTTRLWTLLRVTASLWYQRCSTFICSSGDGRPRWQNDYYSPNNRFWMLSLLSAPLLRLKHIKGDESKNKLKKKRSLGSSVHVWCQRYLVYLLYPNWPRYLGSSLNALEEACGFSFLSHCNDVSLKVHRQFSFVRERNMLQRWGSAIYHLCSGTTFVSTSLAKWMNERDLQTEKLLQIPLTGSACELFKQEHLQQWTGLV